MEQRALLISCAQQEDPEQCRYVKPAILALPKACCNLFVHISDADQ
jgi:hypothetical protein